MYYKGATRQKYIRMGFHALQVQSLRLAVHSYLALIRSSRASLSPVPRIDPRPTAVDGC